MLQPSFKTENICPLGMIVIIIDLLKLAHITYFLIENKRSYLENNIENTVIILLKQ